MAYIFKGKQRVTQIWKGSGVHNGMDIVGDENTNVYCVVAGTVETVHTWDGVTTSQSSIESYGNFVVVKDSRGYRFYYAHLKSMAVKQGQTVAIGDKIGVMGATGNTTGAHCHFEARTGSATSTRTDPSPYCSLPNATGTYYAPTSGYSDYTVVSGSQSLNYRTKASTSGTKKGSLPNGAIVQVADGYKTTADNHTWFKINIGGTVYYMAAEYLQLILQEDGVWGKLTTLRAQDYFGCSARDGEVSNQYKMYKSQNPGLAGGWDWSLADDYSGSKCSVVFKAFQKHVGMESSEQDGHAGPKSFKQAQKYAGTKDDGVISNPSDFVKIFQAGLNACNF